MKKEWGSNLVFSSLVVPLVFYNPGEVFFKQREQREKEGGI